MVLIKRGIDTKSHVHVLLNTDVNVDEDDTKKALSDIKVQAAKPSQDKVVSDTNNKLTDK